MSVAVLPICKVCVSSKQTHTLGGERTVCADLAEVKTEAAAPSTSKERRRGPPHTHTHTHTPLMQPPSSHKNDLNSTCSYSFSCHVCYRCLHVALTFLKRQTLERLKS